MVQEWQQGDYTISTDPDRIDLTVVHTFLTASYWSPGIPRDIVAQAIRHSLVFGVYRGPDQVGFARVVTDYTTFAYIADVFVLDAYRGQGLGKWLAHTIVSHPALHGLRRWMLATRDAHGLYQQVGFTPLHDPTRFMERWEPNIYQEKPLTTP